MSFTRVINHFISLFSRCTNTFAVPANTPISIFVQFEDIPNVAGGDSCTNSKLVFTGASGSDRSLTTCNTANNGNLVRYAAETSAYTLTVSFTPSALENRGLGYLLLLSTCKHITFPFLCSFLKEVDLLFYSVLFV